MYLLYESLYGDLQQENDATNIVGLYSNLEDAIKKAKEMIEYDTTENSYVLDDERKDLETDHFVRLFFNNQENWNCFYEIIIRKMEVK